MSEVIIAAIISCFGGLVATICTFIYQMKKLRSEQAVRDGKNKEHQEEQLEAFKKTTRDSVVELEKSMASTLASNRKEYLSGIDEVKKSIVDTNLAMSDIKASNQTTIATIELRLDHMTEAFQDMKAEVREHNNFAKRMPVIEEQIKVANHRIEDLERDDGK